MNKQEKINQVCEYILSQEHERDHIVEEIVYCLDDKMSKRDTKAFIQGNTTWYIANELYYGKMIIPVLDYHYKGTEFEIKE